MNDNRTLKVDGSNHMLHNHNSGSIQGGGLKYISIQ